jgi:hypothetical protein
MSTTIEERNLYCPYFLGLRVTNGQVYPACSLKVDECPCERRKEGMKDASSSE